MSVECSSKVKIRFSYIPISRKVARISFNVCWMTFAREIAWRHVSIQIRHVFVSFLHCNIENGKIFTFSPILDPKSASLFGFHEEQIVISPNSTLSFHVHFFSSLFLSPFSKSHFYHLCLSFPFSAYLIYLRFHPFLREKRMQKEKEKKRQFHFRSRKWKQWLRKILKRKWINEWIMREKNRKGHENPK